MTTSGQPRVPRGGLARGDLLPSGDRLRQRDLLGADAHQEERSAWLCPASEVALDRTRLVVTTGRAGADLALLRAVVGVRGSKTRLAPATDTSRQHLCAAVARLGRHLDDPDVLCSCTWRYWFAS
ncbi:hypothetical protein SAMN06264364_10898 [Quadrisphaera granulorum]|uniref:Uncharacterized protein n=1 Tax=Quadrisphaera granulorum TaxID=317664 RepID=A0A316A922_9ACTN|nr:hypothetical protein BXY45_10898 [Quadrisphaera granulorum]SZE96330.1 hypothetical protein SAMN06264364_10898 [Quadrisphaera granulorum]